MGFREKLTIRQKKVKSLVCIGLDPLPEKCPQCLYSNFSEPNLYLPPETVIRWMSKIIDATTPYACMYKLQRAHYESMHFGEIILRAVVRHLKENHPDIPVLLDGKRGDTGRAQARYRVAHFELDDADGITFNPYMGFDCMEALVNEKTRDRGIVGLCYTSNLSARQIQDVKLMNGRYLWEYIAEKILEWSQKLGITENTGLVMAAAYEFPKGSGEIFSWHLKRARHIVGDKLWFLIPEIETQEGLVKETVEAAYAGPGSIVINSSAIIFASSGDDFAEAAAKKAKELRDEINQYLP